MEIPKFVREILSVFIANRRRAYSTIAFLLTIAITIFYYRVIFQFAPLIEWGNYYSMALNYDSLIQGSRFLFWNPLGGDGLPNPFPSQTLINYSVSEYLSLILGSILPLNVVSRLYVVFSTLFFGIAFYVLAGRFTKRETSKMIGTLFFLFNTFQIDQLAAGDFLSFFSFGFMLLSLNFVILARRRGGATNKYLLMSIIFLFLTVGSEQFTFLGGILYVIFFIAFTPLPSGTRLGIRWIGRKIVLPMVVTTCSLFLIFTPFLLPIFFGSFINLGPGSPYVQGMGLYNLFSSGFIDVLFLKPYPSAMGDVAVLSIKQFPCFAILCWNISLYLILAFALSWGFIRQCRILMLFSLLIVMAALLGAGPKSIFPSIPIYFYANVPGYQLLNASYYWDWIIISPLYSLILVDIFSYLQNPSARVENHLISFARHLGWTSSKRSRRFLAVLLAAVCLFLVLLPISSQGYYGTQGGIVDRGSYVPSGYGGLSQYLHNLTDGTFEGVAFFPYEQQIEPNGTSNYFNNPIYNSESLRMPYMNSYGSYPATISNYFSFVYNLFYANQTSHISELLGIVGIHFIVVLKGVNTVSGQFNAMNTMILMRYQQGLKMINDTTSYSVFRNDFNSYTSEGATSIQILMGNYYSLNLLADNGFNLSGKAIFLPQDINAANWKEVINMSKFIITQGNLDLSELYVLASNPTIVDTYKYTNYSYSGSLDHHYPFQHWAFGPNFYVPEISTLPTSPTNFVFTQSNSTISIPIVKAGSKNSLWIPVWFSGYSGNLSISVGGKVVQTINEYVPDVNEFKFVKLNYTLESNIVVTFHPLGLKQNWIDALGSIYLVNETNLVDNAKFIQERVSSGGLHVCSYANASAINTDLNISSASFRATLGGFQVDLNNSSAPIIINYPYYSNIQSNGVVLSLLGGTNELVIPVQNSVTYVTFTSYKYWLSGTVIQITTILVYLSSICLAGTCSLRKSKQSSQK